MGKQMVWKYEIGQRIKSDDRDITITNRKIEKQHGHNYKLYQYTCNICGFNCGEHYYDGIHKTEYWIYEHSVSSGNNCVCCTGRAVVKGINSISIIHPEYVQYFEDSEIADKYTCKSSIRTNVKCPNCGTIKNDTISRLVMYLSRERFSCHNCSDRIPLGEKIMYNTLSYLNVDFIKELSSATFQWCGKKRYDFYIYDSNIIIEIMGSQHISKNGFHAIGGLTLEQEQENDKYKYELAIKNGIKEENYITIASDVSEMDYIINNIRNSRLAELYDLSKIDWDHIKSQSCKSFVRVIADYWNEHLNANTKDLESIFKVTQDTIVKYLKVANDLGWTTFNQEDSYRRKREKQFYVKDSFESATPFKCIDNNTYFKGIRLCQRVSEEVFAEKFGTTGLRKHLRGDSSHYKGYRFIYITKQEFNEAVSNGFSTYGTSFKSIN